jgi:hypothetical protein
LDKRKIDFEGTHLLLQVALLLSSASTVQTTLAARHSRRWCPALAAALQTFHDCHNNLTQDKHGMNCTLIMLAFEIPI